MGRAGGRRPSDQWSRLVQRPDKTEKNIKNTTIPSVDGLNFITAVTDSVQHW
jgi:hypothetical protein